MSGTWHHGKAGRGKKTRRHKTASRTGRAARAYEPPKTVEQLEREILSGKKPRRRKRPKR